jgi:hypothetical protein
MLANISTLADYASTIQWRLRAATSNGVPLDPKFPVIDPDDIAEEIWGLVTS